MYKIVEYFAIHIRIYGSNVNEISKLLRFCKNPRRIWGKSSVSYFLLKYQYLTTQKQTTPTSAAGGGKEEVLCIIASPLVFVMNKRMQTIAGHTWQRVGGGARGRGCLVTYGTGSYRHPRSLGHITRFWLVPT